MELYIFQVLLFNVSKSIYQVFQRNIDNLHVWFQVTNDKNTYWTVIFDALMGPY